MKNGSTEEIAQALREIKLDGEQLELSTASTDVLGSAVENAIVERIALAPVELLTSRAIKAHLESRGEDSPPAALLADWDESVVGVLSRYQSDPLATMGVEGDDFQESCSRVFGVDSERCATLLVEFHKLDAPTRLGIYLAIEESPPFAYLQPYIDELPGDSPYTKPRDAMRQLMKLLLTVDE